MTPSIIDPLPSERPNDAEIGPETLAPMVHDVLATMLELPRLAWDASPESGGRDQLMAAIRIAGNWSATLQIYAPEKLARHIACAMFAQAPGVLDDEDVLDAFGEVVNVIGGNLKGMIDQDCTLSLPCVGPARPEPTSGGLTIVHDVCGAPLTIVLVQE